MMQDFTLNKSKMAIITGAIFFLISVYSAIKDFQLPGDVGEKEPFKPLVELEAVDINRLAKTNLFGSPPKVLIPKKEVVKKINKVVNKVAEKTPPVNKKPIKIKVTVTGLLASNHEDFAAAMLKVDSTPEKMYRIGEDLGKPEITLQKIDSDSIVLDNNGNEQIITMERPGLKGGPPGNSSRSSAKNEPGGENLNLPPSLIEELEFVNQSNQSGAFAPAMQEPVPYILENELPPELMDELLEQEAMMDQSHESDIENTIPPLPEDNSSPQGPDFTMPVF